MAGRKPDCPVGDWRSRARVHRKTRAMMPRLVRPLTRSRRATGKSGCSRWSRLS